MVSEKVSAVVEGVFEAQRRFFQMASDAMMGRLDFAAIPHTPATIVAAGLEPAFRAVKANSQRLAR